MKGKGFNGCGELSSVAATATTSLNVRRHPTPHLRKPDAPCGALVLAARAWRGQTKASSPPPPPMHAKENMAEATPLHDAGPGTQRKVPSTHAALAFLRTLQSANDRSKISVDEERRASWRYHSPSGSRRAPRFQPTGYQSCCNCCPRNGSPTCPLSSNATTVCATKSLWPHGRQYRRPSSSCQRNRLHSLRLHLQTAPRAFGPTSSAPSRASAVASANHL